MLAENKVAFWPVYWVPVFHFPKILIIRHCNTFTLPPIFQFHPQHTLHSLIFRQEMASRMQPCKLHWLTRQSLSAFSHIKPCTSTPTCRTFQPSTRWVDRPPTSTADLIYLSLCKPRRSKTLTQASHVSFPHNTISVA